MIDIKLNEELWILRKKESERMNAAISERYCFGVDIGLDIGIELDIG